MAIALYLVCVIGFGYISYTIEKKRLNETIAQQLMMAARSVALILPENFHHKGMSKKDLTAQQHLNNITELSQFTALNNIVYIYSLIEQGSDIVFTSSSATVQELISGQGLSLFFSIYDDVDPRVYDVFNTQESVYIEYSDSWGTFRSVFLAQKAEDGTPYVLAADISISHVDILLKEKWYQSLFISLLFLLFVYPLYRAMTRKLNAHATALKQQVKLQTIELVNNAERLNLALQGAKQAWFDFDLSTGKILISDRYPQLLGYDPAEFKPTLQTWQDNIHPDDQKEVMDVFNNSLSSRDAVEIEYRRKKKDGTWLWFHSIGQVVERDKQKKPCRIVGTHTDITERKQSELVLRTLAEYGTTKNNDIFQKIVAELAQSQNVQYALIVRIDENNNSQANTLAVWAKNKLIDNFSYSLVGTPCYDVTQQGRCVYPNNVQSLFPEDHMLAEMGAVSYLGVPLRNGDNQPLGLIAILDDKPMSNTAKTEVLLNSLAVRVTYELDRMQSDEKLRLSASVFNGAHEGITITEVDGTIIDVNPTFCDITGYSRDEVIGQNSKMLNSDKQSAEFYADMWHEIDKEGFWQGEIWNRKKDGELYAELLTISAIADDAGRPSHYVTLFSDITTIKQQQQSLELMAHYDVLTKLPNRALFTDRFHLAVAHSKRSERQLAICFLDLDKFKPVNDNFGHEVGDQILIEVAKRIKTNIREEDTVSRQGGDEFAILLNDIDSYAACEQTLVRIHHALSQPFLVDGTTHNISASSGLTLYPNDNGDIDTLLRHADQAMYQAKQAGRNRYHLFNAELDQKISLEKDQLNEIEHALLNNELRLYYQPKVNLLTGVVFGVEALLRWLDPNKGLIPPLDFLPLIENTELELRVGDWVIEQALKQMAVWHAQGLKLEVSVNISSHHLLSTGFFAHLDTILLKHPSLNSRYLQLEILESTVLSNLSAISNIINSCQKKLGVTVSLDDFGTGYSSLTHLRNLPVNTIKIDQSFVRDVLDDPSDYAIIDGVIGLADSFNRKVIAEGVETTEHGLMLLIMGCEEAQGYGIARPMPADELPRWLKSYDPNPAWLACAQQNHSNKEKKVKLFELVSEHWTAKYIASIEGPSTEDKHWPIMNSKLCPCGSWIKRAKQEQLFELKDLEQLNKEHEQLHLLAQAAFIQYQQGDIEAARADLAELKTAFDNMIAAIEVCK